MEILLLDKCNVPFYIAVTYAKKGIHMTEAKQNPCEVMIEETGYAEPEFY